MRLREHLGPAIRGLVLLSGALVGCGDVFVSALERAPVDAGAFDGGGLPDAGGAADAADDTSLGTGPFGAPSRVAGISNPGWVNEDPSLSADQLELYFASAQMGPEAIYLAERPTIDAGWGAPEWVTELGSPANEPCLSRDGLTIWFASTRGNDAGASHIWVSSRATTAGPWAAPELVPELMSTGSDEKPSVDGANLTLVFMSNRPGGAGGEDLYVTVRASAVDAWGPPVNLVGINTALDERDPFIDDQDLQLFWAANHPNTMIYSASRASADASFAGATPLSEVGAPNFDPCLSTDLRHLLFASQRADDTYQQIYEAFR